MTNRRQNLLIAIVVAGAAAGASAWLNAVNHLSFGLVIQQMASEAQTGLLWARLDLDYARIRYRHDSVAYGAALEELGVAFCNDGYWVASIPYLEAAAAVYERALGPDNYETTVEWHTLADALRNVEPSKWSARVESTYRRVLATRRRILLPNHDAIRTVLGSLADMIVLRGTAAEAHGDLAAAAAAYREAYELLQASPFGDNLCRVSQVGENLARILELQGKALEATALRKKTNDACRDIIWGP